MTFSPRPTHSTAVSASKTALPTAAPGRRVEALDDPLRGLERRGVERRAQELVDLGRLDPRDGLLRRDDALVDHVDGDPHGRGRGPLRVAGLEHVQAAALDRELEVLDVAVVLLEVLADPQELVVHRRHVALQLADRRRRPHARDDVLALGVGQVLAEELVRRRCSGRA